MTDTQAQILIKQLRCEHKVSRGGNDYLSCDDCGFEWDYRKIASGKEAAETKFLLALSAERDAAIELCAQIAEGFVSSGENKDNWTITRDVLAHDIAAAIRSRVAAKVEEIAAKIADYVMLHIASWSQYGRSSRIKDIAAMLRPYFPEGKG